MAEFEDDAALIRLEDHLRFALAHEARFASSDHRRRECRPVYHHGRKNLYGRAATADRRKRSSE
jgi:hypothetical protein